LKKPVGISGGMKRSSRLWDKAVSIIPCGTQTFSKMPSQFVEGVYPVFLKSGKGCRVQDVDGNSYIDYPLALGPVILGHNYRRVNDAIKDQLNNGIIFSLPTPLEIEVAEKIRELVPSAEMVRFVKTGSEATSAAIRIARAVTGKEKIVSWGYHGWHEWYTAGKEDFRCGIPGKIKDYITTFNYNDIGSLEKIFKKYKGKIACVIMEPIGLEYPKKRFLSRVKKLTRENNALLIFDETITGFRFLKYSAQKYFNVTPDISILGKSLANGMPLAVVAGRKKVMKTCENIFFSSTFAGETLSLRAALETIDEIKKKKVCEHIDRLGNRLKDRFNDLAAKYGIKAGLSGYGARQFLSFTQYREADKNTKLKALFWQESVKRGILFGAAQFISYSHKDSDIKYTLEVCEESFKVVRKAVDEDNIDKYLKGKHPRPIIKKRYR